MRLSERLHRTGMRQTRLGRHKVGDWYFDQRNQVIASGHDPEHPPLRGVIERYQEKRGFVSPPIPEPLPAVHSPYD